MEACGACLDLAFDMRRRQPHDALRLETCQPAQEVLCHGVRAYLLRFTCRACAKKWLLCAADHALFVTWIPRRADRQLATCPVVRHRIC
jgi:hypothetical protein